MKIKALILILLLSVSIGASYVHAQNNLRVGGSSSDLRVGGNNANPQKIPTLQNPLKSNSLTELLTDIADFLIFIGVIIAVFMFIFIGFKFVWAQGDPGELTKAREWFVYAVIGTAILISSKVIVQVIKSTAINAGIVKQETFQPK